jgi:hypothetical protein
MLRSSAEDLRRWSGHRSYVAITLDYAVLYCLPSATILIQEKSTTLPILSPRIPISNEKCACVLYPVARSTGEPNNVPPQTVSVLYAPFLQLLQEGRAALENTSTLCGTGTTRPSRQRPAPGRRPSNTGSRIGHDLLCFGTLADLNEGGHDAGYEHRRHATNSPADRPQETEVSAEPSVT